jgi:hypothetical protein
MASDAYAITTTPGGGGRVSRKLCYGVLAGGVLACVAVGLIVYYAGVAGVAKCETPQTKEDREEQSHGTAPDGDKKKEDKKGDQADRKKV